MEKFIYLYLGLFFINLLLFSNLGRISLKLNIFDKPSLIKLQTKPVPPIGGLFLFINLIFSLIYICLIDFKILMNFFYIYDYKQFTIFIFALITIFLVGLYDDKYNLSANQKLLLLIPTVLLVIYVDEGLKINTLSFTFSDFYLDLNRTSTLFSLICFLAYFNCINMFDGINLQISVSMIGLIVLLQIFLNSLDPILISIILFLIYFSFYNFNSKIYIGDSGTLMLAFVFGYVLIKSHNILEIKSDIIFSFTIFHVLDMLRLMSKRLINDKHPFIGDNDHIHHRLLRKTNLKNAVLIIFFSIITPIILNILTNFSYNIYLIIVSILIYTLLILNTGDKKNKPST